MARRPKQYRIETSGADTADLIKQYNKFVKAANQRIDTITQSKYKGAAQAYKYQVESLKGAKFIKESKGKEKFATLPKNASKQLVERAVTSFNNFMNAKTSTVTGIREIRQKRIAQIKTTYEKFKSPDFPDGIDDQTAEEIAIFLGSEEGKAAKETHDSNDIIVALATAKKLSKGAQNVIDSFLEFKQRGISWGQWQRENEEKLKKMEDF